MDPVVKDFDQLPTCLRVADLQRVMGLSRATAYKLTGRPDFPKVRVGRRIVIPRDRFIAWLEGCCNPYD